MHFYQRIELDNGKEKFVLKTTHRQPFTAQIEVTMNFSNDDTPSTTEFTIHGLLKEHSDLFKKGNQIDYYAGFFNADFSEHLIRHVVHGTITTIQPRKNDSGDWQLSFTMQDGEKYDKLKPIKVKTSKKIRQVASQKSLESKISAYNSKTNKAFNYWRDTHPHASDKEVKQKRAQATKKKKQARTQLSSSWNKQRKYLVNHKKYQVKTAYKALSFKPGTKGSTIIKKIAKLAGIKIQTVKLVYDRKYLKGYTAKKKPLACIKEIAADCNTTVYWKHGFLQVQDFVKQKKLDYVATSTTGLLDPPEYQEDSDVGKSWQLNLLFNPDISSGSVFQVKHESLSGWMIALSGSSTISTGSTSITSVVVQPFDEYKKKQQKSISKKKKSDKAAKAKKDKADREKAKEKRSKRSKGGKK
ncbi:hypothetical protein [Secundilactobacillus oryzae]|uniref:hypothetical protein n=1 Tax=Secundilactobacillus oryzae TaxID=1202668 RepID=UPI0012690EA7|nr:hypothetical protein [Secundilactobacillus oryzae]